MESATRSNVAPDFDALLERVRQIGAEVVGPAAADVDARARFPSEAFDALKQERLLSAYVPAELGGMGLSSLQICRLCEALGEHCASTAMIFAMHQIQVACIVHHAGTSGFFGAYQRRLVDEQLLIASATTERGVGGDLRTSVCFVDAQGDRFTVEKDAPVISYGREADAILLTARRAADAESSDQVHVLVEQADTELEEIAGWDTLGFRGTCSPGFSLRASGRTSQVLPDPFAEILSRSMLPFSHLTWGSLWLGLARDAVSKARRSVRKAMRQSPDVPPVTALRLAEVDELLFGMRSGLYATIDEYEALLAAGDADAFGNFGFVVRVNNVKVTCSELVVDIVTRALQIVGISGYRNDTENSLSRHVRDALGAALMVNNDRIRGHNSTLQVVYRQG